MKSTYLMKRLVTSTHLICSRLYTDISVFPVAATQQSLDSCYNILMLFPECVVIWLIEIWLISAEAWTVVLGSVSLQRPEKAGSIGKAYKMVLRSP
jgi:hypothetical protein